MLASVENLISVTEVSNNTSAVITRATQGETLVVLKNNKPQAAIVGMAAASRLSNLDELEEDLRLLAATLVRLATDSGKRYTLDEVAEELGIDLDNEME